MSLGIPHQILYFANVFEARVSVKVMVFADNLCLRSTCPRLLPDNLKLIYDEFVANLMRAGIPGMTSYLDVLEILFQMFEIN